MCPESQLALLHDGIVRSKLRVRKLIDLQRKAEVIARPENADTFVAAFVTFIATFDGRHPLNAILEEDLATAESGLPIQPRRTNPAHAEPRPLFRFDVFARR